MTLVMLWVIPGARGCMAQIKAAKKEEVLKVRGIWERNPGSGVYSIRFRDADGRLRKRPHSRTRLCRRYRVTFRRCLVANDEGMD